MKLTSVLPFAALAVAIVIPDEANTNEILLEQTRAASVKDVLHDAILVSKNALDDAVVAATSAIDRAKTMFQCYTSMTAFDAQSWLDSSITSFDNVEVEDRPHHGKPHHPPHDHPHPELPTKTVYELISNSKYTTKLAGLINKFPNLVATLNGTTANYTIFAPTDKAFEKLPRHVGDVPDELIYQALLYHVSPHFYPAQRIAVSHTIPTARDEAALGGSPQRLRVGFGLKGLTVNFYARVVAANIVSLDIFICILESMAKTPQFGTNGVIHGVDSFVLPPPPAKVILELLPGEFSTLQLGLLKTGLFENFSSDSHAGGTLFAPNNWAFKKLGPKINAFLFSKYGEKYLKALLQYHIVADETLYSDAFYNHATDGDATGLDSPKGDGIPKGHFHFDLPTMLEGKVLSIDVARFGGLIEMKINAFTSVAVQDGIAKDGVIQVLNNVLIPPKTKPDGSVLVEEEEEGGEMSVAELKRRLDGWVEEL
jgi:uncharacterized surface protein with fasciclin (FAS1) repeats